MGTKAKKRKRTKPAISAVEREEQETERILRRNLARQKRVRALSRALFATVAAADRELRRFATFIRVREGDEWPSADTARAVNK